MRWLWRRRRDREAFARFMREWAEAQEQRVAYTPADVLCYGDSCASRKGSSCDCYRQLERLYGPKPTLGPLAVDLSPPQPLSEAEGLSEASDASDGLLEGKNGHSRKWPDSHLRAHGLLRKGD